MNFSVNCGSFAYKKSPSENDYILKNISFDVNSGELLAVLGANGAGKTTLIRCVTGFLDWNSGESCIDSVNISTIDRRKLWQRIAYVPQTSGAMMSCTVEEMSVLGRCSRFGMFSKPSAHDIDISRASLDKLGILSLADKKCSEISGGEYRLTLIARALAAEPELLILDEPESNLDFRNQLVILDVITALCSEGMACILNTHSPAHALQRADKALVLIKNSPALFGKTDDIITEETICRAFGVKSLIGEIKTKSAVLRDVIPLAIADRNSDICVVSVSSQNSEIVQTVNSIIGSYREYISGRFGMPDKGARSFQIKLVLEAPQGVAQALVGELLALDGVFVERTGGDSQ